MLIWVSTLLPVELGPRTTVPLATLPSRLRPVESTSILTEYRFVYSQIILPSSDENLHAILNYSAILCCMQVLISTNSSLKLLQGIMWVV